jgi:hypothetical protein
MESHDLGPRESQISRVAFNEGWYYVCLLSHSGRFLPPHPHEILGGGRTYCGHEKQTRMTLARAKPYHLLDIVYDPGAPEEIRTPDPQIRSLLPGYAATKNTMNFGKACQLTASRSLACISAIPQSSRHGTLRRERPATFNGYEPESDDGARPV